MSKRIVAQIKPDDKFSRWAIVSEADKTERGLRRYNCVCECGTERIVARRDLTSGHSKSCGCLKKELQSARKLDIKPGATYGRWTVVKEVAANKHKQRMQHCECECGIKKDVLQSQLVSGKSKSCGCLKNELTRARLTTHGKSGTLEYHKEWRTDNADKAKAAYKKYYDQNKKKRYEATKKYREANPGLYAKYCAKRRATKLNATPQWDRELTELVELEAYEKAAFLTKETGIPHEVDHIVPLLGAKVRGLHVWNNLRVITKAENASKSNKLML